MLKAFPQKLISMNSLMVVSAKRTLGEKRCNYVRFEVFTAVPMKNAVLWDVTLLALVRTDVSEEHKQTNSVALSPRANYTD
jgi:hypothetical protein